MKDYELELVACSVGLADLIHVPVVVDAGAEIWEPFAVSTDGDGLITHPFPKEAEVPMLDGSRLAYSAEVLREDLAI